MVVPRWGRCYNLFASLNREERTGMYEIICTVALLAMAYGVAYFNVLRKK